MICFIDCNPDPGVPVFFIEVLFDQNRFTMMGLRFLNFKFHEQAAFVEVVPPGRGPAEAIGLRGKDR